MGALRNPDRTRQARYIGLPQRADQMALTNLPKAEVLSPRNAMKLDTLGGIRAEMSRVYRLALNGKLPPDDLTKLIFALKEIRICIETEVLVDLQRRLTLLSQHVDNGHGHLVANRSIISRS
jgi:hypothetical protein